MTANDFEKFIVKLLAVANLFDKPLSESVQLQYFQALNDLPIDDVLKGLTTTCRTCKFMPKPIEIREAVLGGKDDREADTEVAWLEYKRIARQVGGYRSPTFEDGALGATIAAVFGTWEQACWIDLSDEMWASKRKEFGRVYRVMKERGSSMKQLVGAVERDGAIRGFTQSLKQIEGAVDVEPPVDPRGRVNEMRRMLGLRGSRRADADHPAGQSDEGTPAVQEVRGGTSPSGDSKAEGQTREADSDAPVRSGDARPGLENIERIAKKFIH